MTSGSVVTQSNAHLPLWTLRVGGIQKDAAVDQRAMDVGHHGADVAAAVWSRTVLETQLSGQ